jgi:Predicted transcriptional regulators containing the CopG/Arc/MetJ DNA-binding domain and a metal-binding domain
MVVSVDLPEGLEKEIDEEVGKGMYKSKSELIRDAVRRLLEERNRIEPIKLSVNAQENIESARESDREYSPKEVREALGMN